MKKKILMTGNEAIASGAIDAGCGFYAGYPITPQNELTAYMALHMPQKKRVFIQAESELAAISMLYGASAAGARGMTSSSSPGISLKQEGISYMAGAELPGVIVNIMRGGPGLGNIAPSQADYFQATKGGGHGDYHCIVISPSTVQEAYDYMFLAFDLADQYRIPVIILGDGILGQMMEPLKVFSDQSSAVSRQSKAKPWVLTGCKRREPNVVKSFFMKEGGLEEFNLLLQKKYKLIQSKEERSEGLFLEDAKVAIVAYGSMARIAKSVVLSMRSKGKKVGMLRPITLWPFPQKAFKRLTEAHKKIKFLVTEMSFGQMVEDVRLSIKDKLPVEFFGRSGGGVPTEEELEKIIRRML